MLRRLIGVMAIAVILFVSLAFAPDSHPGQARMICDPPVDVTYSDINVCTSDPHLRRGDCSCVETFSAWIPIYFLAVLPTMILLIAYFAFQGPAMSRLWYLNFGVVLGWLAWLILAAAKEPMVLMGMPAMIGLLAASSAGVSILFGAVEFVRNRLNSRAT
jgi:hypothetical protein